MPNDTPKNPRTTAELRLVVEGFLIENEVQRACAKAQVDKCNFVDVPANIKKWSQKDYLTLATHPLSKVVFAAVTDLALLAAEKKDGRSTEEALKAKKAIEEIKPENLSDAQFLRQLTSVVNDVKKMETQKSVAPAVKDTPTTPAPQKKKISAYISAEDGLAFAQSGITKDGDNQLKAPLDTKVADAVKTIKKSNSIS